MYEYSQGGAPVNHTESTKYFKIVAEQGYKDAYFKLAYAYAEAKGTTQNATEALKWYKQSIYNKGNNWEVAAYNLGFMYEYGQGGVHVNHTESTKYFKIAAEQGYKDAYFKLAYAYAEAKGTTQNATEAVKWYKKSVSNKGKNWEIAAYNLGIMYKYGQGSCQSY